MVYPGLGDGVWFDGVMKQRILVIGGDAAGMTAASTVKRARGDAVDVIVFERTVFTSYSACGIPYWVGGLVQDRDDLVARSPEAHRENGIDVRTGHEVIAIDPEGKRIQVRAEGQEEWHSYDDLVIATGAEPIRPAIPGIDADGVYGVQTLADGERVIAALTGDRTPTCAVVVGSGYVGLEIAEAMLLRGLNTTVIDRSPQPMRSLDPNMGALVAEAMHLSGVRPLMGQDVQEIVVRDGHVVAVRTNATEIAADIVILGIGVRARSALAREAGLPLGPGHAILTTPDRRVVGHDHIWAGGDCSASHHRLLGEPAFIPLGTHANKHGWVIGRNLAGEDVAFDGVIGTAVTKVCSKEIGRTGLTAGEAEAAGIDHVTETVVASNRSGYFPQASPMTVTMVAERATRRILGAQIVGGSSSAIRIDTVATAIWSGMTVDDLALTDLGYSPPFSPVWDPVQVAARRLIRALED